VEEKIMEDMCEKDLGYKPTISIISGVGWLIFIILWLAFYASEYAWEKNFAIILCSILILFLLVGGIWAIWSLRKIPKKDWKMFNIKGFKWRIATSIVLPFCAIIFLIYWFWYYAEPYTVWQNIAILLVTILVLGGIIGSIWARWGIKHGHEMKKFEKFGKKIEKKSEDEDKSKEDD
jgi:amino acid transporter